MITLNRPTLNPNAISDPVQAPHATSAQIEMILKEHAQKLPTD